MATMAPKKLTEGFVKGLKFTGKTLLVRDTAVVGLMVQLNKGGKSYKVQRDLWRGPRGRRKLVKTVRHTLGTSDEMTLEQARARAQEVIGQIKRGLDPNQPGTDPATGVWTVERMYDEYGRDMRTRGCAERSIKDMLGRRDKYLADWKTTAIGDIKRTAAREKHQRISEKNGPRIANMTLKDFKWAYNFALRVMDDPDALADNPVKAVTFNKERSSNRLIMPEDLPDWWTKATGLNNPIRRAMHRLGLLSGLRPGTLVTLRQEWARLDEKAIVIPRMKSGREFALPLSSQMVEMFREAISTAEILFPKSGWIFPTRNKKGEVKATQVWKEKVLPSDTGHVLRHTYRTLAKRAGIDDIDARLLLDHTVPGIDGVYIHSKALFDRLLAQQEKMSSYILSLTEQKAV